MLRRLSLKSQATAFVSILVVVSAASYYLWLDPMLRRAFFEAEGRRLGSQAATVSTEMERSLAAARGEIEALADLPALKSLDPKAIDVVLSVQDRLTSRFLWFTVLDAKGRVISRPSKPDRVGEDRSTLAYFTAPLITRRSFVTELAHPPVEHQTVGVSAPIFGPQGAVVGVVQGSLGLSERNHLFYKPVEHAILPAGWRVLLVDPVGRVIADSLRIAKSGEKISGIPDPVVRSLLEDPRVGQGFHEARFDDTDSFLASARLPSTGWTVIAAADKAVLMEPVNILANRVSLVVTMFFAAALILGVILTSRLTRPLAELTDALKTYGRSGRSLPVHLAGSSDIAAALTAFNEMVAERQRVQIDLRLSQERFELLCRASPTGILLCDARGACRYANPRWHELSGLAAESSLGRGWLAAVAPVDRDRLLTWLAAAAERTLIGGLDVLLAGADGSRWAHVQASPFPSQGPVEGYVCTVIDLTERKRAEAELQRAKETAESASLAKSQFLANMSHEIRTPLTAVLGFTEMLVGEADDSTPENRSVWLRLVRKNSDNLMALIEELLELSRLESGYLRIQRTLFDLRSELEDVVHALRPEAEAKSLGLTVEVDPRVPREILSDPLRLRQILTNIVGNAIKFTPAGHVGLAVSLAGEHLIEIVIKDTGVGIEPEHQGRIFQLFEQADPSTTRRFGGTGLGLTLARRLANRLGGEIRLAHSEVGGGSTFVVTIDAGLPSMAVFTHRPMLETPHLAPVLQGLRVLLVDDVEDTRELLAEFLGGRGVAVDAAASAREALLLSEERAYDAVLMDMQMPELDGFEATRLLRERGLTCPIYAVTALARVEDRVRCLGSGCTDVVTKPLDFGALSRMLAAAASLTPENRSIIQ